MQNTVVGAFLLELRKKNSLTQKDVAMLCNVTTQAVSKWERGDSIPDIEQLEKLSILYKLSINEIINGEKKEVYMNIEMRENIIMVTASVLVFFSYFFNFLKFRYLDPLGNQAEVVLKGYEVIFEGYNGFVVYNVWVVFIILVLQLIIRVFLMTKVVEKTSGVEIFFNLSALLVIIIGVMGLVAGFFVAFPQFIILIVSCVLLFFHKRKWMFKFQLLRELSEFRRAKRTASIPKDKLLDEKIWKKSLRLYRITFGFSLLLYTVFMITILIGVVTALSKDSNWDGDPVSMMMVYAISNLIPIFGLYYFYKYIGSVYAYYTLIWNIILGNIPIILHLINPTNLPQGDLSVIIVIYAVPILIFALLLRKFIKNYKYQNGLMEQSI